MAVGEEAGFFKVVFYRQKERAPKKRDEPINERVVRLIAASPGISKPRLVLGSGKSRATVTRALTALCGSGLVEYRGSKKTGGYYVVGR